MASSNVARDSEPLWPSQGERHGGGKCVCPWVACCAVLLLSLAGSTAAAVESYSARVVHVSDGDTVKLDTGGRRFVFRLAEIDAPELAQPHGRTAHEALVRLVGKRTVEVHETDTDSYGRALGHLAVAGRDINRALVEAGHAWVYTRYARDPELPRLESAARRAAKGLWALPVAQREPPWRWREAHPRRHTPRRKAAAAIGGDALCRTHSYCRQMQDCAEARRILRRCGTRSLDGDGDGVPCEALCVPPATQAGSGPRHTP